MNWSWLRVQSNRKRVRSLCSQSAYSIIDYFQVEAIQFRGQGQRIWPNGSPWASFSEIVGQPDGLDGPSRRRFCRLEFSPSATL